MTQQYPGGYVTKTAPTVSITAAPGIWTLDQAAQYQAAGTWPIPAGQQAFTTPGTYTWVAPQNVTSVSVVCVGAGGGISPGAFPGGAGGGGGALAYANNIAVIPGTSYTVVVGARNNIPGYAGDSSFNSTSVAAGGGQNGASGGGLGGSVIYGTGGSGGRGAPDNGSNPAAGGGAGGYAGTGGAGGAAGANGQAGTGGAGGGGAGAGGGDKGAGGGGVGILGQGSSGAGGVYQGGGGGGGSGGTAGTSIGEGGNYGGGSSQLSSGQGAVRIIWGYNRAFPSTNTGDV